MEDKTGRVRIKKYRKKEYLGKGGFAQCFRLIDLENNESVAGKVIDKSTLCKSRTLKKLMYEISIHKSLDHPNIVRIFDYFEDASNVYIILELCEDGNLNDTFKERQKQGPRIKESEIRSYTAQMISALKYCHDRNIIHRDLKLGNLLLAEGGKKIKLADFGLCAKLEYPKQRRRTICGTPNYIAPEIIGSKHTHSFEVDVWSLGIIIYILFVGNAPFSSKNIKETYRKIRCVDFKVPHHVSISDNAYDLLRVMLEKDSSKRATLEELNSHPFITNNGKIEGPLDEYQRLHSKSTKTGLRPPMSAFKNDLEGLHSGVKLDPSHVWMARFADYSSKFGLGYLLTNGHVGVYFNDHTKMVFNPSSKRMVYMSFDEEGEPCTKKYSNIIKVPETLDKKLRVCQNFYEYLTKDSEEATFRTSSQLDSMHYVKNWVRSRHAIAVKMPKKAVQVIFNDGSEIRMVAKPTKIVTYISKSKERTDLTLDKAVESSNKGMLKRLGYAKSMVKDLLSR